MLDRRFLFLTDPALHADLAVNRVRFRESIIDRRAQRVQRNFPLTIPLRPRNLRAIQAARTAQTNSLRAEIHRDLDRFLHRAAISDSALDLQGDVFRHELCIEFGGLDLLDVDLDLLALRHLRDLFGHLLDFGAFASDHDPGTRSVNGHANAVPGALDDDLGDRRKLQLLLHVIADLDIAMEKSRAAPAAKRTSANASRGSPRDENQLD